MLKLIRGWLFFWIFSMYLYSVCINLLFPFHILKLINKNLSSLLITQTIAKYQSIAEILLTFVCGINIYIDCDNVEVGKSIVTIPNHISDFDFMFVSSIYKKILPDNYKITIFAKSDLRYYPLIGWLLLANDTIFVNRDRPNSDDYMNKKLSHKVNKTVLIFPEGTRFNLPTKIKREAEDNRKYDNLMIPKTKGLMLSEERCNTDSELYVAINFDKKKPANKIGFLDFWRGKFPNNVFIKVHSLSVNNYKYNNVKKRLTNNFTIMDNEINKFINYNNKIEQNIFTIKDYVIFSIYSVMMYFTFLYLLNPYYLLYNIIGITYYLIIAYLEFTISK